MRRCSWCPEDDPAPTAELVSVGFVEQGSGGGWVYYACRTCLKEHDLVPMAEHPPGATGRPLTRAQWRVITEALSCSALLLALMTALTLRR
jgi:hypothetical protein